MIAWLACSRGLWIGRESSEWRWLPPVEGGQDPPPDAVSPPPAKHLRRCLLLMALLLVMHAADTVAAAAHACAATTTTAAAPVWVQKVVELPPFGRGCHVITRKLLLALPELQVCFSCGSCSCSGRGPGRCCVWAAHGYGVTFCSALLSLAR